MLLLMQLLYCLRWGGIRQTRHSKAKGAWRKRGWKGNSAQVWGDTAGPKKQCGGRLADSGEGCAGCLILLI